MEEKQIHEMFAMGQKEKDAWLTSQLKELTLYEDNWSWSFGG